MPTNSADINMVDARDDATGAGVMALIGLGANLPSPRGGPRETLETALAMLVEADVTVAARARWRRTPAHPPGSGPDFVNGAARLEVRLGPEALIALLHGIEARLGRPEPGDAGRGRWRPRGVDLDLLAIGGLVLPDAATLAAAMALDDAAAQATAPDRLILPHPRLHRRAFVLGPLLDVAPDWRHPLLGRTVAELWAALPEAEQEAIAPA